MNLKRDLEMMPLTVDLACFMELVNGYLTDKIGVYGDDSVSKGTKKIEYESRITQQIFASKQRESD